jgi:hypothetical protein
METGAGMTSGFWAVLVQDKRSNDRATEMNRCRVFISEELFDVFCGGLNFDIPKTHPISVILKEDVPFSGITESRIDGILAFLD